MRAGSSEIDQFYRFVGERIKREREELGFNQVELAQEIGLARTSIVNIEQGRQAPPLHVLLRIAQALAVPITDLLPTNGHEGKS